MRQISQNQSRLACVEALSFWKADIDAAYRRVPIAPSSRLPLMRCFCHCLFLPGHRPLAAVAYLFEGKVMIAEHAALPFGSEASVHGWDRIGTEASFRVSCPNCIK